MGQWLKSAVVYQIVLRNFTRDGDFRAAARMLDFVRSAGVDAIYLSPFVEMDRDMDERGWSPRQLASGHHTPKNPYRISNYDRIDPEYGGDADFAEFCGRAHALGMRVLLDLVYLHCGPNNVLKDRISDAFQRNDDGSVRTTQWGFPFLNFASRALRDALVASMRRWIAHGRRACLRGAASGERADVQLPRQPRHRERRRRALRRRLLPSGPPRLFRL